VYILHDDRYQLKPVWLQEFVNTGQSVSIEGKSFTIFQKGFAPGTVQLGGNVHPSENENNNMYTVIVQRNPQALSAPQFPQNLQIQY
ncbi:MAG: hypothetical protein WAN36_05735, partial [Calditrichia bacterium]